MAKLIEITGKPLSGEWGTDDIDGTGIPVLRTTNFTNEGIVNYNNVVTRQINKKNLAEKTLRYGDILLEKSGGSDKHPVGRVVFFEGEENRFLFNNFTALLRTTDTDKWHPKYVFYALFASYTMGKTLQHENRTTGLHNLQTDSYINSVVIPDREIDTQAKIVEHLDKVAEMISLYREQISALDTLIKSRFVEMFGEIRNSKTYSYKLLKDFTNVVSGGTPKREVDEYWENGNIPWVKTTELHNNQITDVEEYITEDGLSNSSAKIVPAGTILLAMYGQGKTRGMTAYLGIEACTNQACACILPSNLINQKFLWQYLILSYDNLRGMAKGGNQLNLNVNMIKDYPIIYPPIELQNEFAAFVEQVNKTKAHVQKSSEELETLKKSLMQQYFG